MRKCNKPIIFIMVLVMVFSLAGMISSAFASDLKPDRESLKNLKGVYVNVQDVMRALGQEGLSKDQIKKGSIVQTDLQKAAGYPGANVKITIMQDNIRDFDTDWEYEDWTRFPERIRALATALQDNWMWGTYLVSHNDGIIKLRKVK